MTRKKSTQPPLDSRPARGFLNSLPVVLFGGMLLWARSNPDSSWWGIGLHAYLPFWVTLLLLTAGALAVVPSLEKRLRVGVRAFSRFLFPAEYQGSRVIFFAVLLSILFWFAAMPFPTLGGDGVHILRRLFRYNVGAMLSFGQLWTEPLTVICYSVLTSLIHPAATAAGGVEIGGYATVFRIVAAILGGGAVYFLLRLARDISGRVEERGALALSLLGCSGTIFFFGYVEFYTFLYFFGTVFMLCGLAEAGSDRFPLRSTLFFLLSLLFHFSAVTFIPAYVFLLLRWRLIRRGAGEIAARKVIAWTAATLAAAFVFYLWYDASGRNAYFIPFSGKGLPWYLYSSRHLTDVLNNLLLGAPTAILVVITLLLRREKFHPPDSRIIFVSLCAIFWFSLLLSHSGVAHDWDVYPLLGVSLAALAVLIVSRIRNGDAREYLQTQLAVQPILLLLPWLLVQTSFTASVERYASITHSYEGVLPADVLAGYYETLRSAFSTAGDRELEVAMIMRSISISPAPYEFYKLTRAIETAQTLTPAMSGAVEDALRRYRAAPDSLKLLPVGQDPASRNLKLADVALNLIKAAERLMPPEIALPWLERQIGLLMDERIRIFDAASFMGHRYFAAKDFAKAEEWYLRSLTDTSRVPIRSNAALPFVLNRLAIIQAKTNRQEAALGTFRLAVAHPSASALTWSDYGFACFSFGRMEEARGAFTEALCRDSSNANALYCLGRICLQESRSVEEGKRLLRKFLVVEPVSGRAEQSKALLE